MDDTLLLEVFGTTDHLSLVEPYRPPTPGSTHQQEEAGIVLTTIGAVVPGKPGISKRQKISEGSCKPKPPTQPKLSTSSGHRVRRQGIPQGTSATSMLTEKTDEDLEKEEMAPTSEDSPPMYITKHASEDLINAELKRFKFRLKKILFRLQPVYVYTREGEPLLKQLFDLMSPFLQGKKTRGFDALLQSIGVEPVMSEQLGDRRVAFSEK